MVLGASFTSLSVSALALLLFGTAAPAIVIEGLVVVSVLSTFVAICSAEARFAS